MHVVDLELDLTPLLYGESTSEGIYIKWPRIRLFEEYTV
jgi:hypothetical protein